jgi:hypothetical protein
MAIPTSSPAFLLHYQEQPDAYWRCDHFFTGTSNLVEETGAYNAAVPGGNAATFATGFTTADGDKGLVLSGGANDYATVASFPAYVSRFTAVGAFKTAVSAKQVIVGKALSASGLGWELFVNASGKVEFKAIATSGVVVCDLVTALTYTDNAVHLAVGVYDPVSNTARLYVDGSAYMLQVLTDGAIGYWRLGEASGTTAADSSAGGANPGTYSIGGFTLAQAGALSDGNTAVLDDGADTTRIVIPAAAITPLNGTTACSWEMWLKPATLTQPSGFGIALSSSTALAQHMGQAAGTFYAQFNINSVNVNLASGVLTPPLAIGTWYHIVVTYDGVTFRIYVNGVQANSIAETGVLSFGTGALWLGGYNTVGGYGFIGTIDEVAIYPRALTAGQIANHYALRTSTSPGSVVMATPSVEAPDASNAALLMIGADDNGAGVGTNRFTGTLDEVALYPYCWRPSQVAALVAAKGTAANLPGTKAARSGIARSGATRSGVFNPSIALTINGVDQSKYLYRDTLTITETAGLPDTAVFTLYTLEPITGQTVLIGSGSASNRVFGGTIVRQRHRSVKQAGGVQSVLLTEITCTDWTYLLNKKLVQASYPAGMLASDAVVDLITKFTTDGFTTKHVKTSPALTGPLTFVNTPLLDGLNTLATAVSTAGVAWKWTVDPYQDLWFLDVDRTAVPRALTPDNYSYEGLDFADDLTQIRTRLIGEGQKTTCPIPIPPFPAGSIFPYASFPVADASQLANSAGVVRVGTQVFPYGSTTPAGGNLNPPGSVLTFDQAPGAIALAVLDLAPFQNHGWVVINGTEYVYYDAVLGLGTSFAITTNSVANASVVTTSTPHGYVGTVIVTITGNVGSVPPINDVWIATVLSTTTFSIPCIVSTGGAGGIVQAGFNQLVTIPASGYGSLGALVKKGASVTVVGYVAVGNTAVNGVTLPAGAEVVQRVTVNDVAAQTLLGAIERNAAGNATDGIHEAPITVPSGGLAAVTQAAQAALTANSRMNLTGSIAASRDPLMKPLRQTLINLPSRHVDARITIQRVTRARRGGRWQTKVDFATTWRDLVAIVALKKAS